MTALRFAATCVATCIFIAAHWLGRTVIRILGGK